MLLMKICLANDSFPPQIDGVVNVVINYAERLNEKYGSAMVAAPRYPDVTDDYSFPVVRYKSFDTVKSMGYRTGYPFSHATMKQLTEFAPDVIHSHCPMASTFLARELRELTDAPLILTYHTKFDIDIRRLIKMKFLHETAIRQMVLNIEACDEVWAVNKGAGENLKSLGFSGDYVIMKNGVDFTNCPASETALHALNQEYNLPTDGTPVFLFVGRILWYKGIRIFLDSLRDLKTLGKDFRMVFVGRGDDEEEIKAYISALHLDQNCIFVGPVYDRERLKAFYTRADLLFLPSVFDNDPLVVKEAAAAHTASVLIQDSSAADGVTHGLDGLLIEENAESMTKILLPVLENPSMMQAMGEKASENLYLSWDDSVAKAVARYEYLLQKYPKGSKTHPKARYSKAISWIGDMYRASQKLKKLTSKSNNKQ